MASLLARIGGFSARHRWWVVAAWLVLLVAAVGSAGAFSKSLESTFTIDGLQSIDTLNTVQKEFPSAGGSGGDVVFAAAAGQKLTPADAQAVADLTTRLKSVPGVTGAVDPFTAPAAAKTLSPDGRIGYVAVSISGSDPTAATTRGVEHAMAAVRSDDLQVEASSGLVPATTASSSQLVGIVLAFVILFITFGSLLAAGLPLVTALFGLGTSVATIYASTAFVSLNSTAPVLAILLSLAVGIDYALFIVNRHRRNLLAGVPVRGSIRLAVGTAGSAVFFAAATVIVALAGLSVVGVGFLTQMGLSAAFGVLVALLVSLTLTPALLSVLGVRVLSKRARRRIGETTDAERRTLSTRWVSGVLRRPVVFVVAAVAVLAILAVPLAGLRLGLPNDGDDTPGTTTREAYDLMAEGFGAGFDGPILVLAHGATASDVPALEKALDGTDVDRVIPSGVAGSDVLLTVIPESGPSDAATETLVHTLRRSSAQLGLPQGVSLEVTGTTAVAIDISQRLLEALPVYLALVAGFAFLLLMVVFRSLLIPLKAVLSFLLSLGAALGATVAVFQWGWLGGLFHVDPAAPLLSFLPILVVGVLFGLSMDYEMFLVSGMRERRAHGDSSPAAVTTGFSNGAKVVAAAALIMIGVFGNGAVMGHGTVQPIAFALAVGVLVDAFVVRMTLVPAVMRLFGDAAWWLPRWLDRVLPNADVEGAALEREKTEGGRLSDPAPALVGR
ncbi:MMPL family transporter [Frondihabitans australicus]|uniref:RND superfamily putative drug exporter n=1 Tax=Frondihabitans australicus TaxID=386892 RepID=A0A495IDJ4_9MICO|nr:MMPL family transporter [Frondihabitans australicus]RKR73710.1 RND superfamily putative drug exporter [Frondihabitans australicus]